eukprot:352834-Chlamydomonas_euryale.AAC.14
MDPQADVHPACVPPAFYTHLVGFRRLLLQHRQCSCGMHILHHDAPLAAGVPGMCGRQECGVAGVQQCGGPFIAGSTALLDPCDVPSTSLVGMSFLSKCDPDMPPHALAMRQFVEWVLDCLRPLSHASLCVLRLMSWSGNAVFICIHICNESHI